MAQKKTKFEITIEKLSIKYEGVDEEEVRQVQVGVNRLLDSLTHTSNQLMEAEEAEYTEVNTPASPDRSNDRTENKKTNDGTRRTRASRDANRSKQILGLKQDGFFVEKRDLSAIREALANKGFNYESKDISSGMKYLTQKGEFQREKKDGNFVYWSESD